MQHSNAHADLIIDGILAQWAQARVFTEFVTTEPLSGETIISYRGSSVHK